MDNKVKTIKNFLEEYERIKPLNQDEFDKNRNNDKICKADEIMNLFDCTSWQWFIVACKLPIYLEKNVYEEVSFKLNMPESRIRKIFPECNVRSIIKNIEN